MKKKSIKRGLYQRETVTAENIDEVFEVFEMLSGELDRYVQDAETLAGKILREAGIDPDTLFDVVSHDTGRYVRYSKIDTDSLSPDADYALKLMLAARNAQSALDDHAKRGALECGIHLAQNFEHLKANLAWLKPVKSRKKSDENLLHEERFSDSQILNVVSLYKTRARQAEKLCMTVRNLQRRLKKINTK